MAEEQWWHGDDASKAASVLSDWFDAAQTVTVPAKYEEAEWNSDDPSYRDTYRNAVREFHEHYEQLIIWFGRNGIDPIHLLNYYEAVSAIREGEMPDAPQPESYEFWCLFRAAQLLFCYLDDEGEAVLNARKRRRAKPAPPCPVCGGETKAGSTRKKFRYIKCKSDDCGHIFKEAR